MSNYNDSNLSKGPAVTPDGPVKQHHRLATETAKVDGMNKPNGEVVSGKSSIAGQPKNY